ncbi:MAG: tetratricopeptide repeat protein, partial [Candidatus Dadabacteria bacterium]|nr:tetratricopeptide repeat protein [Candidatus Dadabacteria bacterium]NIV41454.1 tetratricopeptide repeat protein [Candidatus Dadabacteria bacterium]
SAYINRAAAKARLEDFSGALNDYAKVIELNPKNTMGYFYRGQTRNNIHDYDGAIEDFNKIIELEPDIAL